MCRNLVFFFFFFSRKIVGVDIWSQKCTAKIKMSAVCHIKITGPLTPVMKRNTRDSKVNTIFSAKRKKKSPHRFCPFAGHSLLLLLARTSSSITTSFFQTLAIATSCPVSALPVQYWCRGLFSRGVWGMIRGVLRTKLHCWPCASVIDVKCDHETQQEFLYFWFYWPPCQTVCSLWCKDLHCCTVSIEAHCGEQTTG